MGLDFIHLLLTARGYNMNMEIPKKIKVWNVNNKELYYLLKGRKGGKTTIDIIDMILEKPCSRTQLSKELNVDYKTVTYHLKIVCKYNYISKEKFERTYFYAPSEKLLNNINEYYHIRKLVENGE